MLANFREVFIEQPKKEIEISDAVLDVISKALPENFRYVNVDGTYCVAWPNENWNINIEDIILPEAANTLFTHAYTLEDLLEYSYNAQVELEISTNETNEYNVNGHLIKVEDLLRAPLKNIKAIKGKVILQPEQFPESFIVKIGNENLSKDVEIKRVPNNSISIYKFESIDNYPIKITFEREKNPNGKTVIKLSIEKSKSISEIVEACKIYKSFCKGEGYLNGEKINGVVVDKVDLVSDFAMKFWEKVLKLEKHLGIEFDGMKDTSDEIVNYIDKIYMSLIEGKVIKTMVKDTKVKGFVDKEEEDFKNLKGQAMSVFYDGYEEASLLGKTVNLWYYKAVFNASVEEYVQHKNEYEVTLIPDGEREMYFAEMYFKDEGSMKTFAASEDNIEKMRSADYVVDK